MLRSVCSDRPAAGLVAGAGQINKMDAALHCWESAPTATVTILSCYLELELHGLESGGGLDAPGPGVLSDVHLGGGHGGGLPQQEAHVKSLESENCLDKLSSSGKLSSP